MKALEVVWSTRALMEFDEILAYIRNQDPVTARLVAARIDERVGSLSSQPRAISGIADLPRQRAIHREDPLSGAHVSQP
jgi:plasmid stabilization system protein ParE